MSFSLSKTFAAAKSAVTAVPKFFSDLNESATSLSEEKGKSKAESVVTVVKALYQMSKGMN